MKLVTLMLLPAALLASQARYARMGLVDGPAEVQLRAGDDWLAAERNLPLPESAWVRTGPAARLEIELDDGNLFRLGPESQCEISDYTRLSTGQRITLLSLDRGLAYFTGHAEGKDSLLLAVPGAQVSFSRAARVRLEVRESWSQIWVIEGSVRFSSPAAEIDLREGQTTRVEPSNPARFFLNKEMTAMDLDRWNDERDKALEISASAGHVLQRYGTVDLDAGGEWIQTEDLGAVWKPTVPDGWVPYRAGRWRWYDTLGYTWVSDEAWGWLPYHYGRWTRREDLAWVWVPAKRPIFKPGEVYWMRSQKFVGWGPLAPDETWQPAGAGSQPSLYLNAITTFAGFQPEAPVIDPAGFASRPKDPLLTAYFALALPSPTLPASRLEATRPELRAGSTRVVPVLDGVTFNHASGMAPRPATVIVNPPAPPPVVIVAPQPEPAQTVEVPYPVPVYTGFVINTPPHHPAPAPEPARRPAQNTRGKADPPASGVAREKRFRNAGERELAGEVVKSINNNNFAKALTDLDQWTQRYRESDYRDDRVYYYVLAHNGLQQAAKVVDAAGPLVTRVAEHTLEDQRQMILVLYLASLNAQKVNHPTRDQFLIGQNAAKFLLESVPGYFTPENRPPATSPADWTKARADLEATARNTLRNPRR